MTKTCRRLLREVDEMRAFAAQSQEPWLSVWYDERSRQAVVTFAGPPDSLYAEGVFRILVTFRAEHPVVPPLVKFTHQVFHPNVSLDGQVIASSMLTGLWSRAMSLLTITCHVRDLLSFTDLQRTCPEGSLLTEGSRRVVAASGEEAWAAGSECAGLWLQSPGLASDVTRTHTAANANHSLTFV